MGYSSCVKNVVVHAPPGAVPIVGGCLYPSVLRSPNLSPQESRAAHGPRHPAVTNALLGSWFGSLLGFFGFTVGLSAWFFSSLGSDAMFGLVPFKTRPVSVLLFVSLSFSLSLLCLSPTFFLIVFLSPKCWGSTNPPSVSASRPRPTSSTRAQCSSPTPRSRPAPVFFSAAVRVGCCLFFFCGLVLLGCVVVWWWLVSVCLGCVGPLSVSLPLVFRMQEYIAQFWWWQGVEEQSFLTPFIITNIFWERACCGVNASQAKSPKKVQRYYR